MARHPSGRICFAVVDDQCGFYRSFLPASELARRGFEVSLAKQPGFWDLRSFDTVVFEAPFNDRYFRLLRRLQGRVRLVLDLDDNYHHVEPSNPRYSYLTSVREGITNLIRSVDELIVSSESLAEFYRPYNSRITVIPNMIPMEIFGGGPQPASRRGPLRIGWHGGFSHNEDLQILKTVLPRIHEEYPDIRFVFFGNAPALDIPNADYVDAVPFAAFPAVLTRLRLDIGTAPLRNTVFNRCKTNLKWLEYSALKIPTVASHVLPYSRSIQPGVNGFLAATPEDWLRDLRRLIRDADLRRSIGGRAHDDAAAGYGRGRIGDLYEDAASRWPARRPARGKARGAPPTRISAAGSPAAGPPAPRGREVFLGTLACTLAAMIPPLLILSAISPPAAAKTVWIVCAAVVAQGLSAGAILASLRKWSAVEKKLAVARMPAEGSDAEQSLVDFYDYHRAIADLDRSDLMTALSAFLLIAMGAVSLSGLRGESRPRFFDLLFWATLLESGILMLAFAAFYRWLSRRRAAMPVLPLDAFFRRTNTPSARLPAGLAPAPPGAGKRVLNVGACSRAIPMPDHYDGWEKIYLDVAPGADVDIVADARNMPSVGSSSYDAVYFSHCLEHFDPWEGDRVLGELARVLKPEGVLEVRVPDIMEICRRIAAGQPVDGVMYESPAGPVTPLDVFYGLGDSVKRGNDFMRHKTAFTRNSLKTALERSGFIVKLVEGAGGLELAALATKKA